MKYQVQLKTRVTMWVDVEIPEAEVAEIRAEGGDPREDAHYRAELDHTNQLGDRLAAAGLDHGPIELAHEELDESVREVTP